MERGRRNAFLCLSDFPNEDGDCSADAGPAAFPQRSFKGRRTRPQEARPAVRPQRPEVSGRLRPTRAWAPAIRAGPGVLAWDEQPLGRWFSQDSLQLQRKINLNWFT